MAEIYLNAIMLPNEDRSPMVVPTTPDEALAVRWFMPGFPMSGLPGMVGARVVFRSIHDGYLSETRIRAETFAFGQALASVSDGGVTIHDEVIFIRGTDGKPEWWVQKEII